jgi:hypothetical protein
LLSDVRKGCAFLTGPKIFSEALPLVWHSTIS